MQPSIFGKQLEQVEYSDVVKFCEAKHAENLSLDYKRDLSSVEKVVKTLVSFANTNGGWIVVGVDDDGEDKPKLPALGIEPASDLEKKITDSIISSVTPIVLPLYKVCISTDGKKAFLVAYMEQSHSAPHWMLFKGSYQLFVRHNDRAKSDNWNDTATPNQWELLRNRRKASSNLGVQLITSMADVFTQEAAAVLELREKEDEEARKASSPFGIHLPMPRLYGLTGSEFEGTQSIRLIPAFPSEPITDIPSLVSKLSYERIMTTYSSPHPLVPDSREDKIKAYQFGAYSFYQDERTKHFYFFGMDSYGNILNVDPVEVERKSSLGDESTTKFTTADKVIGQLINLLLYAKMAYEDLALQGSLILSAEFNGSEGCLMLPDYVNLGFNENNLPTNVTGKFAVYRSLDTNTLNDTEARRAFILTIAKEVLYSFNTSKFDEKALIDFIEKYDKSTKHLG